MQKPGCEYVRYFVFPVLFLVSVLVLIFFLPPCSLYAGGQTGGEDYFNMEKIERELFDLVNKERVELGRHPLLLHPALNHIAYRHSLKMAEEGKLSHRFPGYKTLPERMMDAGLYFLSTGENVAFSQVILGSHIHRGFMESAGHRENIMTPFFSHCGIRLARSGDDFYVTQVFAQLYEPLKTQLACPLPLPSSFAFLSLCY